MDSNCGCYACTRFSRAYLRHLYMVRELLAYRLNTIHNLHYFLALTHGAAQAILQGKFATFKTEVEAVHAHA